MRMKSYGSENSDHMRKNHFQGSQHSSPQELVYKLEDILDRKMKRSGFNYSKPGGVSIKNLIIMAK